MMTTEMRQRALAWFAKQWVGFTEHGGANKGQAVELFQRAVDGKAQGEPWCAAFVSFLVMHIDDLCDEVTLTTSVRAKLRRTELCWELFHGSPDCFVDTPVPGCVVVWNKPGTQLGHCGIVTGIYDGGVITVEGNTGTGDQREGDGVAFKRRDKGDVAGMVRLGYLAPWGKAT